MSKALDKTHAMFGDSQPAMKVVLYNDGKGNVIQHNLESGKKTVIIMEDDDHE